MLISTAILNADNFATKYYYDAAGRLWKTERETEKGFEPVATYQYNYAGRLSVTPSTQQDISYHGVNNLEFGYTKSTGLDLVFEKPSWIGNPTVTASVFKVNVEPNNTCYERQDELVVKTDPATDEVHIPFVQEPPLPDAYNFYITDENEEPLTDNGLHIDDTYHIKYSRCRILSGLKLVIYQYQTITPPPDLETDYWYRRIHTIASAPEYGTDNLSVTWTVPDDVNIDPNYEWNENHLYRIHIENPSTGDCYFISDIIHILPSVSG